MTKGIYEEFDGYHDVVEEIEASRKFGVHYSKDVHSADPFIKLLHPPKLKLRVSDLIDETPSTKTLRLVSQDGYLPPFLAGQYIRGTLRIPMMHGPNRALHSLIPRLSIKKRTIMYMIGLAVNAPGNLCAS